MFEYVESDPIWDVILADLVMMIVSPPPPPPKSPNAHIPCVKILF